MITFMFWWREFQGDVTRSRVSQVIHPRNGLCAVVAKQSASATAGIDLGMFLEDVIPLHICTHCGNEQMTRRRHSH